MALVPLVLLTACNKGQEGELVLRLRWSAEHRAGLAQVRVEPDWGGVSRHPVRDAGWQRFGHTVDQATLLAAPESAAETHDGAVLLTAGQLPAGDYRRVFVSIPRLSGVNEAGRPVAINGHIEPIARSFRMAAGQRVTIDLVLALLKTPEASPFEEPVQAFVMGAFLVEDERPPPSAGDGT